MQNCPIWCARLPDPDMLGSWLHRQEMYRNEDKAAWRTKRRFWDSPTMLPSGTLTYLWKIAIEIVDIPIRHGDCP